MIACILLASMSVAFLAAASYIALVGRVPWWLQANHPASEITKEKNPRTFSTHFAMHLGIGILCAVLCYAFSQQPLLMNGTMP